MNLDYKYLTISIILAICFTTLIIKLIQVKTKEKVKDLKLLDIVFEKELMKKLLETCTIKHKESNFIDDFLQIIEQYFAIEGLTIGTVDNELISYLHPSPNLSSLELIKKLLKLILKSKDNSEIYSHKSISHEGRTVYLLKIKTAVLGRELLIHFIPKITLSSGEIKFLLQHISHVMLLAMNLYKQNQHV
jgi:hypothetical protein